MVQYSPHGFCLYVIVEGELYSNMSLYEIFIFVTFIKCMYLMMFNQRQDNLYATNLILYCTFLELIIYLKPINPVGPVFSYFTNIAVFFFSVFYKFCVFLLVTWLLLFAKSS